MNTETAISVKNVSKTLLPLFSSCTDGQAFRIPHEKVSSLRGAFTQSFSLFHLPLSKGRQGGVVSHSTYEEFKALDDVSFEVKKGGILGATMSELLEYTQ